MKFEIINETAEPSGVWAELASAVATLPAGKAVRIEKHTLKGGGIGTVRALLRYHLAKRGLTATVRDAAGAVLISSPREQRKTK